jgi:hypothetical protein
MKEAMKRGFINDDLRTPIEVSPDPSRHGSGRPPIGVVVLGSRDSWIAFVSIL